MVLALGQNELQMKVTIKIIHAFDIQGLGGNPAGVVLNADKLDNSTKQLIAAKLGMSETAFVSSSTVADFKLDFFTPTKQIAHCGHATIAVFTYLKQIGEITTNHSSKETIDGVRTISFIDNKAYMEQRTPSYLMPQEQMNIILHSLNIKPNDLEQNKLPTIVNTGNSFLLVPVKGENILSNIQPDFDTISRLSEQFNLIGYYVYTSHPQTKNADATTRMFAPFYGISEESATGMAAGPLACFLYKNGINKSTITLEQGKFMNPASKSNIHVNLHIKDGQIINLFAGGSAFLAEEKTIEI